VQEDGWAPELNQTERLEEKSSASVRDQISVTHSIVKRYTDCATWLLKRKISSAEIILIRHSKDIILMPNEHEQCILIFSDE
jgi:hypothetical protein